MNLTYGIGAVSSVGLGVVCTGQPEIDVEFPDCTPANAGTGNTANPCGSGYTWDASKEMCIPTQARIDAFSQFSSYFNDLLRQNKSLNQQLNAGAPITTQKAMVGGLNLNNPFVIAGGVLLAVMFFNRR